MSNKPIIQVQNLSKKFYIGRQSEDLRKIFKNLISRNKEKILEIWALNDISFDVNQGEVFGIIGPNGSGKSTLLKILSKITYPTKGKAILRGRVSSLLEVGTGFHPELTGRENIYLNGSILGMKRNEIKNKFDEIVAFSGIERFIDTPVKHYSSGMYVRLAFSVAAHLEPEILLVDEVLSVGDMAFRQKSMGKMKDVAKSGRTVLFVSHNLNAVESLCDKGLFLDSGKIIMLNSIEKVIKAYKFGYGFTEIGKSSASISNIIEVLNLNIYDSFGLKTNLFSCGDNLHIELIIESKIDISNINLKLEIKNEYGLYLFVCNNYLLNKIFSISRGVNIFKCLLNKIPLNIGKYIIELSIIKNRRNLFRDSNIKSFEIVRGNYYLSGSLPTKDKIFLVDFNWIK